MKAELRQRLHASRNALLPADRERFSESITRSVLALDDYRRARTVMAYMTFGSEFMTRRFVHHLFCEGKLLVLPRIRRADNRLELYQVRDLDNDLAAGPWGIREPRPDACATVELPAVDFVLVPGLAFNVQGDRLGYGRGYYDRLLVDRHPRTALVAAAFSVQLVEHVPVGEHDVPVDLVITERSIHRRVAH
ncbi:MAG: 5-formyltetrahydrofolate cyclo-ligase [Betaproteobacteria bacterium]